MAQPSIFRNMSWIKLVKDSETEFTVEPFLAIVILLGWIFQWFIHVLAIVHGKLRLHRRMSASAESACFLGVTIIKPLMGFDVNLHTNLETFFTLNYAKYELLFCVEDNLDPAVMVVQSLLHKYPSVDAQIFIGAKKLGINPKINNIAEAYDKAKYELLLISDSNIKINSNTLLEMVSCCTEEVGLVHQLPFVCDRQGFSAALEKIYFGTQHAKMYLLADRCGFNCITGMSCLLRKTVLDDLGGIGVLGKYLAEDYYLGQLFLSKGWGIRLCSQPALQNSGNCSVELFQARMMRWTKLRIALAPMTIVMEPLSECIILGLLISWSCSVLFNCSSLAFFFVHLLIWFLLDYVLLLVVQGGPLFFSKFDYLVSWLFREITSFYLILKAHSSPTLMWRSRKYIIRWGAIGEEVKTLTDV